jgi:hypothetical protein
MDAATATFLGMDVQTLTMIVTAGMSVATVWLAIATQRMATAAKVTFDLEARPYLGLERIEFLPGQAAVPNATPPSATPAMRTVLVLKNHGKVLVEFHVDALRCTHSLPDGDLSSLDSMGGVIFPGADAKYLLPFRALSLPPNLHAAPTGEMEFSISFWANRSERQRVSGKVTYRINKAVVKDGSLLDVDTDWHFLRGPSYSAISRLGAER